MALVANRDTPTREGVHEAHPVKAATKIFAGSLVCIDANGWAVPGSVATTLKARGRAEELVDNTAGANGDKVIRVRRGRFRWKNSAAGDAITRADIGATAYVVDDETVAKTNGTNTRSAAGEIVDVDAQGVWIKS